MVKNCLNCGKQFDGVERKFCSWQCDENYKKTPGTKPNDAVKDDKVGT
jgi:predicted nucleic acid-binding Zn ribbon protein